MSPMLARPEDPAAIRAALLRHLTKRLSPLFVDLRIVPDLRLWLAPLSTQALIACLRESAADTANALTGALVGMPNACNPGAALQVLAGTEYPELPEPRRLRLGALARALRDIAVDNGGCCTERDLLDAGFKGAEIASLLPLAKHLIAILDGKAEPRSALPDDAVTPGERLCAAGLRTVQALEMAVA